MSIQKKKKSPSKRNMRRSHDFLKLPILSLDKFTKEIHYRYHLTNNGFYKGKKIIK